nr:MAG TPA: hypothetical protein [Caudoviricetes sp.]
MKVLSLHLSINYLLSKELLKGFKLLVQTSCEIFAW